ncbi:MAG: hypothetical protein V1819_03695 [bacterium]
MSEFGKGFILPLIKFAEHLHYAAEHIRNDEDVSIEIHQRSFISSAADHLDEMEVPSQFIDVLPDFEQLIDVLSELRAGIKIISWDDLQPVFDLLHKIARGIDEVLGVEGDIGKHG